MFMSDAVMILNVILTAGSALLHCIQRSVKRNPECQVCDQAVRSTWADAVLCKGVLTPALRRHAVEISAVVVGLRQECVCEATRIGAGHSWPRHVLRRYCSARRSQSWSSPKTIEQRLERARVEDTDGRRNCSGELDGHGNIRLMSLAKKALMFGNFVL